MSSANSVSNGSSRATRRQASDPFAHLAGSPVVANQQPVGLGALVEEHHWRHRVADRTETAVLDHADDRDRRAAVGLDVAVVGEQGPADRLAWIGKTQPVGGEPVQHRIVAAPGHRAGGRVVVGRIGRAVVHRDARGEGAAGSAFDAERPEEAGIDAVELELDALARPRRGDSHVLHAWCRRRSSSGRSRRCRQPVDLAVRSRGAAAARRATAGRSEARRRVGSQGRRCGIIGLRLDDRGADDEPDRTANWPTTSALRSRPALGLGGRPVALSTRAGWKRDRKRAG